MQTKDLVNYPKWDYCILVYLWLLMQSNKPKAIKNNINIALIEFAFVVKRPRVKLHCLTPLCLWTFKLSEIFEGAYVDISGISSLKLEKFCELFLSIVSAVISLSCTEKAAINDTVPCLLHLAVNHLGFPSHKGSSDCERSKVCICVFSLIENIKAFSGEFIYNPTTFSISPSNSGSVLFPHQYSTLWGLRSWDFNIPCTVIWLMPSSLAILRWLQLE